MCCVNVRDLLLRVSDQIPSLYEALRLACACACHKTLGELHPGRYERAGLISRSCSRLPWEGQQSESCRMRVVTAVGPSLQWSYLQ